MLNFCVFTFIVYAVGNSVRVILFGNKNQRKTRVNKVYTETYDTLSCCTKCKKTKHNNVTAAKTYGKSKRRLGTTPKRLYLANCLIVVYTKYPNLILVYSMLCNYISIDFYVLN